MAKKARKSATSLNVFPRGKLNNLLNFNFDKFINFKSKKFYLTILIAAILFLAIFKPSLFIAATVNGTSITNLELQMRLNEQFKNQLLNQMINEKIILNEASKANAIPSATEIDQKIVELETNLGGSEILDNLLSQQGQTRTTLKEQVRLQLAVAKLYDKDATVSAEEVSKFIEENRKTLQSTDSAKQQEEAYNFLKQQKISQIFNQKFQELREKANIKIF